MMKSLKSMLAKWFGLSVEVVEVRDVPVEGHSFRITHLRPFKGHSMVATGWRDGSPAEIALSLVRDGSVKCGEYIKIGGQRWRAWGGAITPVDPAKRQYAGQRRMDRERRPNPCTAK
jgi:hypothetical protein